MCLVCECLIYTSLYVILLFPCVVLSLKEFYLCLCVFWVSLICIFDCVLFTFGFFGARIDHIQNTHRHSSFLSVARVDHKMRLCSMFSVKNIYGNVVSRCVYDALVDRLIVVCFSTSSVSFYLIIIIIITTLSTHDLSIYTLSQL